MFLFSDYFPAGPTRVSPVARRRHERMKGEQVENGGEA